ncbi:choice-of-anchor D domain-containing protein [Paraliomyxa miuraensis]|uniref:choice-of-anchor D domain-containing protein n=1 Tax=Paraliomyxa miuraensis TaxID=376150 RepID=UPI00224EB68C|nr:choice-of-anchor D domain-containing protein [Paraliomyxa miuraensis]MCX4245596.1 choice-of-anchor D domain-containing protein [Paraliomyxa miuraensis]
MWGRGTWAWGLGLLIPLVGCSPNTGGVGTSTAASIGDGDEGTDGPSTSDAQDGPHDTGNGEGGATSHATEVDDGVTGADSSPTSGQPATTTHDGGPLLVIAEGPSFDYGNVVAGTQTTHVFTVSNEGDAEATGIASMTTMAPFSMVGGTCGASLTPSTSCTVEVQFAPSDWGPYAATLSVAHDDGEASCDLAGGASGQSDNLISNPAGENTGTPPPSWSDVGAGNWTAGNPWPGQPNPFLGMGHLAAYDGPSNEDYVLRQDIDVSAWAQALDQGVLRFSFQGRGRSYLFNNDSHRIRIRYRDAGGTDLDTWDTGWQGAGSWQVYDDDRTAPSGTRSVRVDLLCRKTNGDYCDAYYDELDLRASYP